MAKYKIIPSSRVIVRQPISIGHKAEKGVEAIEFDLTAWVETYGSGTLTVIMRRWGDAIPYPIALEIDENNKATWTLSDIDTAKAGMAYAQLNYIVGDEVVKKSDIYTFRVMDSLTGEGEPPEAYESWLEHLTHLAAEAMAEVLDIEGIVTDKTLTVDGGIADGKATGDALALKADKSTTYTKAEVDQMIEDVEVETDTTLEVAGAAADAAETGRQIDLLKADLDALETHVDDALFIKSNVSNFEAGTINATGVLGGSSKRVRSKEFINIKDLVSIILTTDNLKVLLRYYDETQTYISGDNYFTVESIYDSTTHRQYPENASFIKIVAAYNDDSTITDVSAFNSLVETNVNEPKFDILDDKIVDIAKFLNDEGYINLGYKHGNVNYSSGVDEWNNLARAFSHVYIPANEIVRIVANNNAQYSLRYYDENKQYLSGMSSWSTSETFSIPNNCKYVRVCGRYSSNAEITNLLQFADDLMVYCKSFRLNDIENKFPFASNNKMFAKSVGNASIVCAKELTNDDGNCPAIEWYLLEEAGGTNRFYVSRDLHEKQFAFLFTGDAYKYSFGILANGDIIAVLDASSIDWDDAGDVPRSETFRKNPYVFLASENWSVQHEVAFTGDLKPLGWLSNYGFRVLPDGSAVFAEYTRYCVLTANVWRVNGDPTDSTNWNAVISLTLPEPGLNLLKHWHTVQYDPYGKVAYAATGDSNSGSFCYYSTDYGVTWTQLSVNGVDHSDKYFRFLNLIFTEDYIYWAKDWYDEGHYLFKCGRNANGILDIDNAVDWIQIPTVENLSTYTTCYIPEIDAVLLLEREDSGGGTNAPAPIRLCDLTDGTLHTVAYMKSAKGVREQIGFRTRYSEVYPIHGIINIGWALRRQINAEAVNLLAWYDNAGKDTAPYKYGLDNVNNLWLEVYKNSSGFKLRVGTRLI